jgi:hypothetical protein
VIVHHCGPSCRVHWWEWIDGEGRFIKYPIRVPNFSVFRTLAFELAPEDGSFPLINTSIIVHVGPAAPFPHQLVRFHADGCFLDGCDGGCLYE